jgi:metallophosphoesterase (TIGR03767 family)
VRTELIEAQVGREGRRRSLLVFHHFADVQALDEESPLRGEWQDSCPTPLSTSAFRPQEALTLQVAAALVRQANAIDRSPLTERAVDFLLHTGNLADNAQYNELRWFIDLMDGRLLQPDSGASGYEGVQSESPDARFPELLAQAQLPFRPEAIAYPWYTAVGSRDLLVAGSFPPSDASRQIAIGGEKVIDLSPARKEEVCDDPSILLDPETTQDVLSAEGTEVRDVTPDESRRLLDREGWMRELFRTAESPGPPGHGLTQRNLDEGVAYYAIEHGPLSFIVLDTVNPAGFAAGSIDREQFEWLGRALASRSGRYYNAEGDLVDGAGEDKLVVVVSHHPLDRLNNPLPGASGEPGVQGEELASLLHRFPNVIAHVTGHSQANGIVPRPDPLHRGGSYWELTTTSPVGYPMQGRLLEVVDNGDGTLSLFSSMYDLAAPADARGAKDPTPDDDVNEEQLAAVARSVAALDPQRNPEAAGFAPSDRNAEMLLAAPFDLSSVPTPGGHQPAAARAGVSRRALLRALSGSWLRG